MKISTTFHKKVPVPGLDYASQGFHLTIEAEPPPEVQQNRDRLRSYVAKLFAECRARVEDELDQACAAQEAQDIQRPHRPIRTPRSSDSSRGHNGRGNGRAGNSQASPKQINFIRSLGTQAGFTYDDLGHLAQEAFGKHDLRTLTKKEASAMIDNLRNGDEASR